MPELYYPRYFKKVGTTLSPITPGTGISVGASSFTLGATEQVSIDAYSSSQTQTGGTLYLSVYAGADDVRAQKIYVKAQGHDNVTGLWVDGYSGAIQSGYTFQGMGIGVSNAGSTGGEIRALYLYCNKSGSASIDAIHIGDGFTNFSNAINSEGGNALFKLGATDRLHLDASNTAHTNGKGVIDLDLTSGTDNVFGIYILSSFAGHDNNANIVSVAGSGAIESGDIIKGIYSQLGMSSAASGSKGYSFHAYLASTGSATNTAYYSSGNWTYAFYSEHGGIVCDMDATNKVYINASSTAHTDTNGVIDLDVVAGAGSISAMNINFNAAGYAGTYGLYLKMTSGAISGTVWAHNTYLNNNNSTGGSLIAYRAYATGSGSATMYGFYAESGCDYGFYSAGSTNKFVFGATNNLVIDADSTHHTNTAPLIDIDLTADSTTLTGMQLDIDSGISGSTGIYVNLVPSDVNFADTLYGFKSRVYTGGSAGGTAYLFYADGGDAAQNTMSYAFYANGTHTYAFYAESGSLHLEGSAGYIELKNNSSMSSTNDYVKIGAKDLSAGNTMLAIQTEGTCVGTGTPTADRTIAIDVNGTTYYLLASTSSS